MLNITPYPLHSQKHNHRLKLSLRRGVANETPKTLNNIKLDKTTPTGLIQINSGTASSTSVTLTLTAQDETSGVAQIRLSNDGTWNDENWQDLASTKQWTLTAGEGGKTVYYQIVDNAGLESARADSNIRSSSIPKKTWKIPPPSPFYPSARLFSSSSILLRARRHILAPMIS